MSSASRVVETILPALAYNSACSSTVSLQNLADRAVFLDLEGHRSDGALVPLEGRSGTALRLAPGESGAYKLQIKEDAGDAWVKIRERVPAPDLSPGIAVGGFTECVSANELFTAERLVAYPTANPWLTAPSAEIAGEAILVINVSEQPAEASVCYSSAGYYAVPATPRAPARFRPICSTESEVQIAPFGARRFQIGGESNSTFSLRTRGAQMVLQMLKPVKNSVRLYSVDSTIKFGEEVPAR
jgi:hypothetical protein